MALTLISDVNPDGENRPVFSAFLADPDSAEIMRRVASEQNWAEDAIQTGDIAEAVSALSVTGSPRYLVIDLSGRSDVGADMNALAEVCEPGTTVIALGTVNDVAFYRELLASGIHDYLVKPVTLPSLTEAIRSAIAAREAPDEIEDKTTKTSPAVAFVGIRGGVGTSLVVTSCAHILAHQLDRSVVLLDLDFEFGTSSLIFDLEPGRGLKEALANPGRLDELFIERAIARQSDKLSILGAENPVGDPLQADPEALGQLIDVLAANYEIVAIDAPRHMICSNPGLLEALDELVLVTDLSLAAVRDSIRLLALIRERAADIRVTLVVNKDGLSTANEVSLMDFEASVEQSVHVVVPFEAKGAVAAAKKGQALSHAAPRAKASLRIAELAQRLASPANEDKTSTSGFWSSFMGRKNK